jgi:uncharacterized membrane protein YhaH (DUF805 family)
MNIAKFSSRTALFTSVIALITFVVAFLTPPLSGPACVAEMCYKYPFLDVASRFPRDYYWMFLAIVMIFSFLVLIACIYNRATSDRKLFGLIALAFGIISTTILFSAYFVQLSVVQPGLLAGESDGLSLLTQFNPHGAFIALEEAGFIVMSISFLFAGFTFIGQSKLEKAVRRVFTVSFVLMMITLFSVIIFYGFKKEYFLEIYAITIAWFTLIINGFLLHRLFKKNKYGSNDHK